MQRKEVFAVGELYHIFGRGVNGYKIFWSEWDYQRLLLCMLLANSVDAVRVSNVLRKYPDEQGESLLKAVCTGETPSNRLVDIFAYALMPNHYHLIVREVAEGGVTRFMSKMLTAYSMFFNKKHERTGPLFEKPFNARLIDNDAYFMHIFAYVHLNPVDLFQYNWKQDGLKDKRAAIDFLNRYPYSSFVDVFSKTKREEASIVIPHTESPWGESMRSATSLFSFYEQSRDESYEQGLPLLKDV